MNRLVSLLLVALSLVAVTLAQPAQAQWVKNLPYFPDSDSQSSQPGTTTTATINNKTTGHVNITSTPTSGYPGYATGGTYSGNVGIKYTWTGGSLTEAVALSTTQSSESTGAGNSASGGNSMAGGAYGNFPSSSSGWDTKASSTTIVYFAAGDTPATQVRSTSNGGNTSAYYSGSIQSTIITADVAFGDPVVTQ